METVAVIIRRRLARNQLQMLALQDPDKQLLQTEIRIDIFGQIETAAYADQLIDQLRHIRIVAEMILVKLQLPVTLLITRTIVIIIQVLQRMPDIRSIDSQGNALGGVVRSCFREVDDHRLIGRNDHRLSRHIFKSRLIEKMHDLLASHHTGDDKIPESQRDPIRLLITFEHIELAIIQIENTPVLHQGLKIFRMRQVDLMGIIFYRHRNRIYVQQFTQNLPYVGKDRYNRAINKYKI